MASITSQDSAAELVTMLNDKGELPFAIALAEVVNPNDSEELQEMTILLTHLFDAYNLLPQLVVNITIRQIAHSSTIDTALRGSSFATSVLSYSFLTFGSTYLQDAIEPIADCLTRNNCCYEVNPLNIEKASDIDRNRQNLVELASEVMDALIANRSKFPAELRSVLRCVHSVLAEHVQDEDHATRLVGGMLLFLRFVNPFLTSGFEGYSVKLQEAFTLVAKLFQAAANGHPLRQPHMQPLNGFCELLKRKISDFIAYLLKTEDVAVRSEISSIRLLEEIGFQTLHHYLNLHQVKLIDYLSEHKLVDQRSLKRMRKLLDAMGTVKS